MGPAILIVELLALLFGPFAFAAVLRGLRRR